MKSKFGVDYVDTKRKPFEGSFHKCVEEVFHIAALVMLDKPHLIRRPFGTCFELHGSLLEGKIEKFAKITYNL